MSAAQPTNTDGSPPSLQDLTPFTESWLLGPSSTNFYTRTYAPPSTTPVRALIVFLHGFAEHIARYAHFQTLLAQDGVAVFAFDQRGFGRTAMDVKNKSAGSAYGKTNWKEQENDIQWAVGEAKKKFPDVPTFLMGHSMGGGETLGFVTHSHDFAATNLAGIIATSPLIHQTRPAPRLLRWAGAKVGALLPNVLVPANVVPEHLSHDPACGKAYMDDPLVKQYGSLRGIGDMLNLGESLLLTHFKNWPESLPALFVHGTDDQITSCEATKSFHDKIPCKAKVFKAFAGGYHELHNEEKHTQDQLRKDIVEFVDTQASKLKSRL